MYIQCTLFLSRHLPREFFFSSDEWESDDDDDDDEGEWMDVYHSSDEEEV